MSFDCSQLDQVLRESDPSAMAAALEHAKTCLACRRDLDLWQAISAEAPSLRKEWDSPYLWTRIAGRLAGERRRSALPFWALAVAAALVLAAAPTLWLVLRTSPGGAARESALLTDQALRETESAEAAYVQSIDRLAKLAAPRLSADPSPLAAAWREKLLLLDSGIAELKAQAQANRLNAHLRTELAALYRDKQQTLKEILDNVPRNP